MLYNSLKERLRAISISSITSFTLLVSIAELKAGTIERHEWKSEAIKACINWLKKGTKYTYHDDGTWLEDNNRICVDGSKEYGSKEITGMEDPSIEPKNYNNMPNPIEMKIIRFFAYREDDGTPLSQ